RRGPHEASRHLGTARPTTDAGVWWSAPASRDLRALMRDPRIVFGDEPTGALNSGAAAGIMDLLVELNAEGTTRVIVTHDENVAARADRVVHMADGRMVELEPAN